MKSTTPTVKIARANRVEQLLKEIPELNRIRLEASIEVAKAQAALAKAEADLKAAHVALATHRAASC